MKITLKFFILFLLSTNNYSNKLQDEQKKFVIGPWRQGFFSAFIGVLNNLAWCDRHNRIPVIYWNSKFLYFDKNGLNGEKINAWEYYFEPVSKLKYKQGDALYCDYYTKDHINFDALKPTEKVKLDANKVMKKYIKLKPEVNQVVDKFFEKNIKNRFTVAIHLRGTDKHLEVEPVPIQDIINKANSLKAEQYFIASDDQALLDKAKKLLNAPVIHYDFFRSSNNGPIHIKTDINRAKAGQEVLVEVLTMAKCNYLVHTISNVSTSALFFNPKLKHILLTTGGSARRSLHPSLKLWRTRDKPKKVI